MLKRAFLLAAISASSLFASQEVTFEALDCCPTPTQGHIVCDPVLKKILAPDAKKINPRNIKSGKPLYAHTTHLMTQYSPTYSHQADYLNGTITTIFGAFKEGFFYDQVGEQTVMANTEDGSYNYYRSTSCNWDIEIIDGQEYIVHHHKYFNVYTNGNEQYVRGK